MASIHNSDCHSSNHWKSKQCLARPTVLQGGTSRPCPVPAESKHGPFQPTLQRPSRLRRFKIIHVHQTSSIHMLIVPTASTRPSPFLSLEPAHDGRQARGSGARERGNRTTTTVPRELMLQGTRQYPEWKPWKLPRSTCGVSVLTPKELSLSASNEKAVAFSRAREAGEVAGT